MSIQKWEHFFKPEVRNNGCRYITQKGVSLSKSTQFEILSYIKGTTQTKVSLKCLSLDSERILASCSCSSFKKGQLCKHIWATLLRSNETYPDFFDGKNLLEQVQAATSKSQTLFKEKQKKYRQQLYKKQKERIKSLKKKTKNPLPSFPKNVECALAFFNENGFSFENPIQIDDIRFARKKLSRVFHPDIGGTHEEILALNKNFEILLEYVETQIST